jgi:hypothetical protein
MIAFGPKCRSELFLHPQLPSSCGMVKLLTGFPGIATLHLPCTDRMTKVPRNQSMQLAQEAVPSIGPQQPPVERPIAGIAKKLRLNSK